MTTNRVALVTGANQGIGRAIAEQLGRDGHIVIATAIDDEGVETINSFLNEQGIKGQGILLDVTNSELILEVMKQISNKYPAPTVLVNNAGITRDNLLMRLKDEDWQAIIDTNLTSVYRMSKAVLRGMMKAHTGRIINIASVVGSSGNAGQTNYSASKAGILGFSKSLAREVASRGITVNAIAPGFINTDMTKQLSDEQRQALLEQIPLQRLGEPQDIASVVGFLASEHAAYITGQTIHVNGGMYMA